MERVLNKQICLNCNHQEKYHNPVADDPIEIHCQAFIANYISDMTEGLAPNGSSLSRCHCKEFRMDNLKYMEAYVSEHRSDPK